VAAEVEIRAGRGAARRGEEPGPRIGGARRPQTLRVIDLVAGAGGQRVADVGDRVEVFGIVDFGAPDSVRWRITDG
jgi:hypothetical protein